MALSNVTFTDVDGNLSASTASTEKVSAMLFDVSLQPTLFTAGYGKTKASIKLNEVIKINGIKEAEKLGIIPRVAATAEEEDNLNFMHGLPYFHIREFYRLSGNVDSTDDLYVMFADCSTNWNAIELIQRASGGVINQLGVYTEQNLWTLDGELPIYKLNLVSSINDKAVALAVQNQPLSIVLQANCSSTGVAKQINFDKIPSCLMECSRTSVVFGQPKSVAVTLMQKRNVTKAPVGCIGAIMGCLSKAGVEESIAWVKTFNLYHSDYFSAIEFGFGDLSLDANEDFTSTNVYESISPDVLDALDDKGYIFPIKYAGKTNGIYFSKDRTCSTGDYRTIARNRAINKSRRLVRAALLPQVNSPLYVDPATGYLSSSKITAFKNIVDAVLVQMKNDGEISGYTITISSTQNVLLNDTLLISYRIVPVGTASAISVEEGLALTNK